MPQLSVTVITRNEARRLEAALASVSWADEIIVVDAESTDDTLTIARRFTDRIVVRPWSGFTDQRNYATSLATHDWILSLDADERVTPALAGEIQTHLGREPEVRGYRLARTAWYLGRWIRSTDWYPDYQLRLYDRRHARWSGRYIHESVALDGPVGVLRSELEHHPYTDISDHLRRIDQYTTLAARQLREEGRRAGAAALITHPVAAFLRNYIARGGFRQGAAGAIVSVLNSYYVFLKLAKLWELERVQPSR